MNLICFVDINNGMMFNNRRQSRDKILNEYIIKHINNKKLWVNEFSRDLFEGYNNLEVDEKLVDKAEQEDYIFLENIQPKKIENKIDKIFLFNWNRNYPANLYFDIDLTNWKKEAEYEIVGSSHEKISETIYIRGNK